MSYVYLSSLITETDIELNDVGVIQPQKHLHQLTIKFLRNGTTLNLNSDNVVPFDIHETGDRFDHKVCDRCFKRLRTEVQFENNRLKKNNVMTKRPSCRLCRKLKDGKSIPTEVKQKWEETRPEDYTSFTCPICDKTTIVGISKVVLDHDHCTGKVRGWLCESCNTGIGRFDDDPQIVQRAITWLREKD